MMKPSLQLRLGQQLTLTPQLQQSIRLLQLSAFDLRQEVQDALESNLMLEPDEEGDLRLPQGGEDGPTLDDLGGDGLGAGLDLRPASPEEELHPERTLLPDELPVDSDWSDIYDGYIPTSGPLPEEGNESDYFNQRGSTTSLRDHLLWQLNLSHLSATDEAIATVIVDAIDEDGYLGCTLEEIRAALGEEGVTREEVEAMLHQVQSLEPTGVGARSLQECLLLQLRQLPTGTPWCAEAIAVCRDHFDLLATKSYPQLKRRAHLSDGDLEAVSQLIRSLNPRPGSLIAPGEPQYLIPDVLVSKRDGAWRVELNPEAVPRLRINPDYARLVRRADQSQDNTCLKNHLSEARWFIKSLASRNETLVRVASSIVALQQGFLEQGEEALKPLVLRDVAEALEMHESTISRVTTQKYMHTPRGTFELKYFFSSHLSTAAGGECSSTAIRAVIRKLIAAEPPNKPLSDNRVAAILGAQGVEVARRTVAKYREGMGIPPSHERKRLP